FPYNCTAYACANSDNTWSITIINKEETKGFDFNIHLSNNASHVDVARLTGPSMTSSNDIKFAGNTIAPDGTFSEAALEQYNISQQSLHLNVPAGSAAVITLR
ncbi:MAG: glycosyl hydrolase family protein, partial [Mucilaginibacter sp.]